MYSNALIATDQQALSKHRQKVLQTNTIMSNENEINTLKYEITNIKQDVNKILESLQKAGCLIRTEQGCYCSLYLSC